MLRLRYGDRQAFMSYVDSSHCVSARNLFAWMMLKLTILRLKYISGPEWLSYNQLHVLVCTKL